jgi:uncharacterized integral membrane protein (TIGR00698 family)
MSVEAARTPPAGFLRRFLIDSSRGRQLLLALAAAAPVAAVAVGAGRLVPLVGAPVFGIVLGMLIGARWNPSPASAAELSFVAKFVLQAAIVLLGATLSLGRVASVGHESLPVMLGTLAAGLAAAALLGHVLGVGSRLTTLVGVGTGICGASAIAAVSGVVAATGAEIGYAIATIFIFNIVAVVVFPAAGHLLGLDDEQFGLWAGTAVNDTSSVVATAYAFGDEAGAYAVVVKLTRATMIVPIVLVLLALSVARHRRTHGRPRLTKLLPWFLLWFLVASVANTAGLVPASLAEALAQAAGILIVVALAAVGLSARLGEIRNVGLSPLVLGAAVWGVVAASGLLLQWAT